MLQKAGIDVAIMTTVSKTNVSEIPDLIDLVVKHKADIFAFATVDEYGNPQVRNVSAIHYEEDSIYFYTAQGKNFCKELKTTKKVQLLGLTMYKEMIRLSGDVVYLEGEASIKWRNVIFEEQPYLENIYPGDTKDIGAIFMIKDTEIEYFNLSVYPIFRESYTIGDGKITPKGFRITDSCINCGKCERGCPQKANPFTKDLLFVIDFSIEPYIIYL